MFVPVPVYVNVPAFAISFVVITSFALVVKLFSALIITFFCSMLVPFLFVTVPSIIKSPVPFIVFLFSPPVNTNKPSFPIPSVPVVISLAFAVNLFSAFTVIEL